MHYALHELMHTVVLRGTPTPAAAVMDHPERTPQLRACWVCARSELVPIQAHLLPVAHGLHAQVHQVAGASAVGDSRHRTR